MTRRVRTKTCIKVQQLKCEEGSVVSEMEGRSNGRVASGEGSDAGLGQGGSGSVCSISYDRKTPIFPLAGLAALPFGADGAALPLPLPPPPRWRPMQHA